MKKLFVLLIAVVFSASACSPSEPWAAKVNGQVIDASLIDDEVELVLNSPTVFEKVNESLGGTAAQNAVQPMGKNAVNSGFVSQALSDRVLGTLLAQEVKNKKVAISADIRTQADQVVKQQYGPGVFESFPESYRNYLIGRMVDLLALLDEQATPDKVEAYYKAHQNDLTKLCVRHILLRSAEEANAVRARILGGEDFAAIAKSMSLDNRPGASAADGGSLGCFTGADLDSFIPPFANAIRNLPANQLSEPVETEFGFHLIEVTTRSTPSLADAQADIKNKLSNPNSYVDSVLSSAKIEVNPRYGVFSPANAQTGQSAMIKPRDPKILADSKESSGADVTGGSMPHSDPGVAVDPAAPSANPQAPTQAPAAAQP